MQYGTQRQHFPQRFHARHLLVNNFASFWVPSLSPSFSNILYLSIGIHTYILCIIFFFFSKITNRIANQIGFNWTGKRNERNKIDCVLCKCLESNRNLANLLLLLLLREGVLASGHDQHATVEGWKEGQDLLFENFHVHILSTFDIEINEVWHRRPLPIEIDDEEEEEYR